MWLGIFLLKYLSFHMTDYIPCVIFFNVAMYCLLVAPVSKNNHFMKIAFYSLPFILDTSSPMDEESRKTNNIQV